MLSLDALQDSPSELGSPGSPERSLGLRTFVKSFSAGSRGYEKMHNAKQNMKQLLMPWKRKNRENDEEEVQSNDDFGTHPVLQVSIKMTNCNYCVMSSGQANAPELACHWRCPKELRTQEAVTLSIMNTCELSCERCSASVVCHLLLAHMLYVMSW